MIKEIFDKDGDMYLGIFKEGDSYEVMYKYNQLGEEYNCFGGSVGYNTANFKTLSECDAFINKGIANQSKNPDIWLDMVAVHTN